MSNRSLYRQVPTRWGPPSHFDLKPVSTLPFRVTQDSALEQLKDRLLAGELNQAGDGNLCALLRRAANEAASLAWASNFPLLVFPVLFEEKARQAHRQNRRQRCIRRRSAGALARAA